MKKRDLIRRISRLEHLLDEANHVNERLLDRNQDLQRQVWEASKYGIPLARRGRV